MPFVCFHFVFNEVIIASKIPVIQWTCAEWQYCLPQVSPYANVVPN